MPYAVQKTQTRKFHGKIHGLILAGVLLMAVPGCDMIPNLGPKPQAKPAASYAAAESFTAPAADWPAADWWTIYKDPQLNDIVTEALQNSPDMALAAARVRSAEGQAEAAGAPLYPAIDGDGTIGKTKQSYNQGFPPAFVPHGWLAEGNFHLSFDWELDFWGKNRAALAAATSEADAARLDAEQAKLMLTTNIVTTYANLAQLYADRDTTVEAIKVRHATTSLFTERFKNGLETQGSERQSESQEATEEASLRAIDESIALARNALAQLMGAGPDRGHDIKRPAVAHFKGFGLPKSLQLDLISRRPDIAAAKARAEAAADDIKVARTEFYPDIDLAATFGYTSLGLNYLTDRGSQFGTFGPAIHLPIFEGGKLTGNYTRARGEYDAAVAQYNSAMTKALQDIADVAVSERALQGRLEKTREAVRAAEQAHKVAQDRYRGGLSTYLDVLNAEDLLINTRKANADLTSRVFTLDVALVKALGGGFIAPPKGKAKPAAETTTIRTTTVTTTETQTK